MSDQIPLTPPAGYENSRPRQEAPITALVAGSVNWLVGRGRYRRRSGSATQVAGILESKWGALARRMVSAALRSLANKYPTWLALFVNEPNKMATLAFRSTNGTPAARVLCSDFGAYNYGWPITRTDGIPRFRVVPYVYENDLGGLTLARGNYEKARRFIAGGSRNLLRQGNDIAWGGYTSSPGRWNGRFNDSATTGDESLEVFPLGMIPPLQMPGIQAGNDLGGSTVGPWRGSDAFFYSVVFENETGELSAYPIPAPPNSAWVGYGGFGYFQVSAALPAHYFDSLIFTGLPIGPPGIVARRIIRSTKVTVDTTALSPFPAAGELFFCARIANNTDTSYTLRNGNDFSLDTSPIPQDLIKLIWPKRARYTGRFDGHEVLGYVRPNPYALIVAPWGNGAVNAAIDDASLYGATGYFAAVTPTNLVMRSVTAGVATDASFALVNNTLSDLVAAVSAGFTTATVNHNATYYNKPYSFYIFTGVPHLVYGMTLAGAVVDVFVGDTLSGADWPAGTKVTGVVAIAGPNTNIYTDRPPTASYTGAGVVITFTHRTLDTNNPGPWAARAVPGADPASAASNLLTTYVPSVATWSSGGQTVTGTNTAYISPGMFVVSQAFPVGAYVDSVNVGAGTFHVSAAAYRANLGGSETLDVGYDTGDTRPTATTETLLASGASTASAPGGDGWTGSLSPLPAAWADNDHTTYAQVSHLAADTTPHTAYQEYATTAPVSATGLPILFVRVVINASRHVTAGNPVCTVFPSFNENDTGITLTTNPGEQVVANDYFGTPKDYVFDLPYDPSGGGGPYSGVAWTAAKINAHKWGACMRVYPSAAGDATSIYVHEFRIEVHTPVGSVNPGFIRMFGNAWPAVLPFNKAYLDTFNPMKQTVLFSAASPGYAQDGINTYFVGNQRSGPADFGPLMGMADMGPLLLAFFLHGRCRVWNPRTGLTHADDDYTITPTNWTRGAVTPYLICSGNGWAIFVSEEGVFGTGITPMVSPYTGGVISQDAGDAMLSQAIFDAQRPAGQRGELEYAINRCIAAAASDSDDFAIWGYVETGVLYLNYFQSEGVVRQLRYDFSAGAGKQGLDELIVGRDQQGQPVPYPWSPPQTLTAQAGCKVAQSDGLHHYAAVNDNLGTTDGRVDEIDTGTEDNGVLVQAIGYTGLQWAEGLNKLQPRRARGVVTKDGAGFSVSTTRTPAIDPATSAWDVLMAEGSGTDDFGRFVIWTRDGVAGDIRDALGVRIMDDGTGPCPDLSKLYLDVDEVVFLKPEGGA